MHTDKYQPWSLLPPANEVWGKVIFLHLFVILFTGGGIPGEIPPAGTPPGPGTPPGTRNPPGTRYIPGTRYTPLD